MKTGDLDKIKEVLTRGVEEVIEKQDLQKAMEAGHKLRVKLGIDPTGPKLHLGRAIPLWKLRAFQDLGHQIVIVIGDFTAQVGDASDKQSTRKPLTSEEINQNMKTYKEQIGKILDLKKTEFRKNSEWLSKIKMSELVRIAQNFTVQQMINRRNFKERWDAEKPIGLHEILYPIFQGYDSVAIKADVEMGGSDQLFNLKVGRVLQEYFGQKPQNILTMEMINGLDGRKMSTSWGNVVNIADEPNEQYGKIMSMDDSLIVDYLRLATDLPIEKVNETNEGLESGTLHPKQAKMFLARKIVETYHGQKKANEAEQEFDKIFQKKEAPSDTETFDFSGFKDKMTPVELLLNTKLIDSVSAAKRLIKEGGMKIGEEVIKNRDIEIELKDGMIIKAGPRKFAKIKK